MGGLGGGWAQPRESLQHQARWSNLSFSLLVQSFCSLLPDGSGLTELWDCWAGSLSAKQRSFWVRRVRTSQREGREGQMISSAALTIRLVQALPGVHNCLLHLLREKTERDQPQSGCLTPEPSALIVLRPSGRRCRNAESVVLKQSPSPSEQSPPRWNLFNMWFGDFNQWS